MRIKIRLTPSRQQSAHEATMIRRALETAQMDDLLHPWNSIESKENQKLDQDEILIIRTIRDDENAPKIAADEIEAFKKSAYATYSRLLVAASTPLRLGALAEGVDIWHIPSSSEKDFHLKLASRISRHVQGVQSEALEPSRESVHRNRREIFPLVYNKEHILEIDHNGVKYELYCKFAPSSKKLVVFGQDAITRSTTSLPKFFRWSWMRELPYSTVVLNDPTLYLDDDLNGGWFIGTQSRDYAKECSRIIADIAAMSGIKSDSIIFFGASAGGFSSLAMAACLPGSRALVDIPQTNLQNYHAQSEVDKTVAAGLGFKDAKNIPSDFLYRINSIERFRKEGNIPDITYLMNKNDINHFRSQLAEFMVGYSGLIECGLSPSGALRVETYDRYSLIKGGHFPMSKTETIKRIILASRD